MIADLDLRLIRVSDAAEISALTVRNRGFHAPFDPIRPAEYFTEVGQRGRIASLLSQYEAGTLVPLVITLDGAIAGVVNLNNVVRGSFESASLGYWVDEAAGGRGVATAAVGIAVRHAFDVVGLHRLEAGTLVTNVRSQRVLAKNAFTQYGLAPKYLKISGEWQDHVLFQRLAEN